MAFADQVNLQELLIPWNALLWGALLIISGYFLFAVLAAALGILLASLALSIWLTARIFRAAMLNYGKALCPQEVWRALRQA